MGFGVKTTRQATDLAGFVDGVVVGSHFVSQITSNIGKEDVMINNLSASASVLALAMQKEQ